MESGACEQQEPKECLARTHGQVVTQALMHVPIWSRGHKRYARNQILPTQQGRIGMQRHRENEPVWRADSAGEIGDLLHTLNRPTATLNHERPAGKNCGTHIMGHNSKHTVSIHSSLVLSRHINVRSPPEHFTLSFDHSTVASCPIRDNHIMIQSW